MRVGLKVLVGLFLLFVSLKSPAQLQADATDKPPVAPPPAAAISPIRTAPASKAQKPQPKLTPQQERGLRMLKSAEAEAAGLQPDMRAYIELLVAYGYEKTDPKKSVSMLEQAFVSTQAIVTTRTSDCWGKDEACRTRQWLQMSILDELVKRAPAKAQALLPKADEQIQDNVNSDILEKLLEEKKLDEAKQILDGLATKDNYPYGEALKLMKALPAARQQERTMIFTQALTNFQQYTKDPYPNDDDFAGLLARFWRDLPPALALEGADAVLKQAKDADDNDIPTSIQTMKGDNIRFKTLYDLRLFEMLPILRELDKGRAESLLREHNAVEPAVQKFPQGMQSIPPETITDEDGKKIEVPGIINFGYDGFSPSEGQEQSYIFGEHNRIGGEADSDPKQALADAMALPQVTASGYHPQVGILVVVAEKAVKSDPNVARAALAAMRKQIDLLKPLNAATYLIHATDIYLKMGDKEDAVETLKEGSQVTEKLYAKDADHGDPNQAFKGNWPSANLWGRCVQAASLISSEAAEEIIATISDPEIQAFTRTRYGAALAGFSTPRMMIVEQHKDGRVSSSSY